LADSGRKRSDGISPAPRWPDFTSADYIRLRKIEAIDANCRKFIKYGFLAIIAFCGYKTIAVLAGRATFADVAVRFAANITVAHAVSYAFGAGGVAYGAVQKKLRGDVIKKMAKHVKRLEEGYDDDRGSSGLTDRGGTRPEDQL
jgi:p-aminobenzoyl-glutamate transporter AbgT